MSENDTPADEESSIDRRSAHMGIVCTHHAEIKPLLGKLDRQRSYIDDGATFRGGFLDETIRIAVIEAGSGFARHRQATQTLIAEHQPKWILSLGFSSPLTDETGSGDVCIANEICDTHGNTLPVKCFFADTKRVFVRKHVAADQHPRSAQDRTAIAESTAAFAVDTTSLAVAQACLGDDDASPAAKFLSLRVILGNLDDDLSEKAAAHFFEPAPLVKKNPLGQLFKKLKRDPELADWHGKAEQAAQNLNRFALGVIRKLS